MSCRTIFPVAGNKLETAKSQLETAKAEAQKEFPQEKELAEKVARLGELNVLLDMDKKDRVVMEEEPENRGDRAGTGKKRPGCGKKKRYRETDTVVHSLPDVRTAETHNRRERQSLL